MYSSRNSGRDKDLDVTFRAGPRRGPAVNSCWLRGDDGVPLANLGVKNKGFEDVGEVITNSTFVQDVSLNLGLKLAGSSNVGLMGRKLNEQGELSRVMFSKDNSEHRHMEVDHQSLKIKFLFFKILN